MTFRGLRAYLAFAVVLSVLLARPTSAAAQRRYGYGSGYGYGGGSPTYSSSRSYDEGAVRIKVKPREASVYVDGYYTGRVDDFDGVLQKLHLSAGPHRIEVRLQGYEALVFDVRIEPDQTVTYHGDLRKTP